MSVKTERRRSYRRPAIVISIVAHVALAILLLFWYLPRPNSSAGNSQSPPTSQPDTAGDVTKRPPQPKPAQVPPDQIVKSVESQIDQIEPLSDEEKLQELDKNLQRLESISDEQTVQSIADTVASSLGVDPNQYAEKPPADGPMDINTAQLADVIRTRDENGVWKYESVMVDAQGRRSNVPMSEAEGKTVYDTFQTMKQYPFAESIYRGVVMPLIQKTMEAEQAATEAARQAQRMQAQQTQQTQPPTEEARPENLQPQEAAP